MFFDIFVQVLGFVAIAANLISVQFNTHGKIMLFKSIGSFLFCVQYLLLGAYAGLVMDAIGTIRNIVFARNVKKGVSNKRYIVIFAVITFALGVFTIIKTWDKSVLAISWISQDVKFTTAITIAVSVLSIIAKLLTTISYGFKNPQTIRLSNIPSCSCWLVYNIVAFSLAGILNEIMTLSSIVIAELRYRKKPANNTDNNV